MRSFPSLRLFRAANRVLCFACSGLKSSSSGRRYVCVFHVRPAFRCLGLRLTSAFRSISVFEFKCIKRHDKKQLWEWIINICLEIVHPLAIAHAWYVSFYFATMLPTENLINSLPFSLRIGISSGFAGSMEGTSKEATDQASLHCVPFSNAFSSHYDVVPGHDVTHV